MRANLLKLRAICKGLRVGAQPNPAQAAPVTTIVCGWFSFSQLTCLQVQRCEKLETKLVSAEEASLLVQKGRKYLYGILFLLPPTSSKTYKETLSVM